MSKLTGLFQRGNSYYVRVLLPDGHPSRRRYRSGRVVLSVGACGHRDAVQRGTIMRAQVLSGVALGQPTPRRQQSAQPSRQRMGCTCAKSSRAGP